MARRIHEEPREALDHAALALDPASMASALVPCPHCHCHAKSIEVTCPSCGEPLRRSDGSVPRTTVAVLLGLSAAGALAGACDARSNLETFPGSATSTGTSTGTSTSTSTSGSAIFYGPAMTTSSSGGGGNGGGGAGPGPFYGPAMTTSSSGGGGNGGGGAGPGPFYGPAMTSGSGGGSDGG